MVAEYISFSEELAKEICDRIATGESLRQIGLLEGMPAYQTISRWVREKPEFREQYACAKQAQADYFAEELLDIADDGRNDWEERENTRTGAAYIALNDEAIARAKLRIETRKWLMGKLKPKKYGDRTILAGDEENPIHVKTEEQLESRIAELLRKAGAGTVAGGAGEAQGDESP